MKKSADYPLDTRPIMGFADDYLAGFVDPRHCHQRSQLSYSASGVMSVITDTSSFMLPPYRAVWIPAGMMHEVFCRAPVSSYTLYIDPSLDRQPQRCRVFEASELVKALIFEVGHFPVGYDLEGRIVGGPSRNRTGVYGFAVRCVTTPPSGLDPSAGGLGAASVKKGWTQQPLLAETTVVWPIYMPRRRPQWLQSLIPLKSTRNLPPFPAGHSIRNATLFSARSA